MSQTRKIQRRMARQDGKSWRGMMHQRELAARERRRRIRLGLPPAPASPDTPAEETPTE